jgi:hypothetical protein
MVFNATFNNMLVLLVTVSFIGGGNQSTGENHRPVSRNWQTLLHNDVSSTPRLNEIRTHKSIGNRHWLHR